MVKTRLYFVLWLVLGLMVAACAPTRESTAPTTSPVSDSAAEQPTVEQSADRYYQASDLARVANTGRPQFLDSYADW